MPLRLVLWDIDHTLVELGRFHYDLYARALPAAFGVRSEALPDMTGRTDRDISGEFLHLHGIATSEENLARFWEGLVEQAKAVEIDSLGVAKAGAETTLATLGKVSGLHQSVLTGNLRPLAERKLSAFGLDRFLDFGVGGYGEDSVNRSDLVAAARQRFAARYGRSVHPAQIVLVGDTPRDVQAAHRSGARIVAVATGRFSAEDLAKAGAETVLRDLTDLRTVVEAVTV